MGPTPVVNMTRVKLRCTVLQSGPVILVQQRSEYYYWNSVSRSAVAPQTLYLQPRTLLYIWLLCHVSQRCSFGERTRANIAQTRFVPPLHVAALSRISVGFYKSRGSDMASDCGPSRKNK
jgi:hypothetical protein